MAKHEATPPKKTKPHDSWAEVYDEAYKQSFGPLYIMLTEVSLEVILEKTESESDILDIGAGTGRLSIPLAQSGHSLCAVDASAKMLEVLERNDSSRLIKTVHCPIQILNLNQMFDTVLCVFSVFCYLTKPKELKAAIHSIARHTNNTGYALIDIPSSSSFSGLNYESETLSRQVTVTVLNSEIGLFNYEENVRFIKDEKECIYKDNFQIRCWNPEVILLEFETAGMTVREDISQRFLGSGAHYYILAKT
ncbi:class I SAM-dependent methyltransferase [Paracoccaceae bacterium]|nr:class I SAM-dependent methyltransferase [Paracoccaceae bacterium]